MSNPKYNRFGKKDFLGRPIKRDEHWERIARGGEPPNGKMHIINGQHVTKEEYDRNLISQKQSKE